MPNNITELSNNLLFLLPSTQLFPFEEVEDIKTHHPILSELFRANRLANENKIKEALIIYDDLSSSYADQPFLYACKNLAYNALGEDEDAFYNYQIAKRLDFNYHNFLEWKEYADTMELSSELIEFDSKIQNEPNHSIHYTNRAMLLVQHFDYEKALKDYAKAYSIDQNDEILLSAAVVKMRLLRYDQALEDFNIILENNISHLNAHIYRAKLYMAIKEYELALADFNKAISLSPEYELIFEERASLFELMENWEAAIADYTALIRIKPEDFYGYVLRADIYEKAHLWQAAINDYTKAIDLNPYYADLYQYRGAIYEQLGDQKSANMDYKKFEELEDE